MQRQPNRAKAPNGSICFTGLKLTRPALAIRVIAEQKGGKNQGPLVKGDGLRAGPIITVPRSAAATYSLYL